MAAGGQAVFELAPAGAVGEDDAAAMRELDWMTRLAAETQRPVSFTMIQTQSAPDLWRKQLDLAGDAVANGIPVYAQFAARPFGMLFGFPGYHAFDHRPTFRKLKAELAARSSPRGSPIPRCARRSWPRPICRRDPSERSSTRSSR